MAKVAWVVNVLRNARTRLVLLSFKLKAKLLGSTIDLDVGPGLRLGRRVRFRVDARTHNRVHIGSGCIIQDDVVITLRGGTIEWGDRVEIRHGTVMNLSGTFRLVGKNVISYSNVIHCATSITLDEYASTNEYVSIIDSTHHHDGEHEFFYENTSAAPIVVGPNVWICNKASVLMGTTIGANAVIASHAVVNRDVPEATVVGGLPAKVLAPRHVAGPALRFSTQPLVERATAD